VLSAVLLEHIVAVYPLMSRMFAPGSMAWMSSDMASPCMPGITMSLSTRQISSLNWDIVETAGGILRQAAAQGAAHVRRCAAWKSSLLHQEACPRREKPFMLAFLPGIDHQSANDFGAAICHFADRMPDPTTITAATDFHAIRCDSVR
jgi:hypothetical protein